MGPSIVWITLVVELLDIWIRTEIGVGNYTPLYDLLVVTFMHRSDIEKNVFECDGREHQAKASDTNADTLRMHVVEKVGCGVEGVVIDLHAVQRSVRLNEVREDLGGVSLGKGVTQVIDVVVNLVSLDAVSSISTAISCSVGFVK